ncbi:MAG: hypothetical protein ACOY99_09935 [Pseudomonadota bacterium]
MTKLNALQTRTLALLQEMAADPELAHHDQGSGEVAVDIAVHGHHDHVHIGRFTVSARFASGLANPNVWAALERKGLIRSDFPYRVTLTQKGLAFVTGVRERMLADSDH